MLIAFRERYGVIPYCNVQGKHFVATNEFQYFALGRVNQIISDLSADGTAAGLVVRG